MLRPFEKRYPAAPHSLFGNALNCYLFSLFDKYASVTILNSKLKNTHEEAKMFEVTEKATEMIRDFLKDRDVIPAIRVMLSQGG